MSWRPYFEALGAVVGVFTYLIGLGLACDTVENRYGVGAGFATMGAVLIATSAVAYWLVNRPPPHFDQSVPPIIARKSRVVSWLWLRGFFSYDRARKLARWLP